MLWQDCIHAELQAFYRKLLFFFTFYEEVYSSTDEEVKSDA